MKRKAYLAALAMCVILAVSGCGDKEEAGSETTATEASQEENTDSEEVEATPEPNVDADGHTRLVSVDNVEKYVTIADYKGIVVDNTVAKVTDEDVDNRVVENLQNNREEVTDENATVQDGDVATINFVGTKDGVAFEGGTANNYDLTIGSGTMIPGFEEGIVGMKKGETKDVTVTFPENYQSTDLAGQEAVFQITVQAIKRAPELTDDWVAANTDVKTIDEYKATVRTQLEEEAAQQAENSRRSTAWNTVYTNSEVVEYPEKDVEDAVKTFKSQAEAYAKQAGMELEAFVESQGISMDDFEEQCQQYAQAKVKQNLIIQGIMDAEGMTLEDADSLAIQDKFVQQYASGDLAALIDGYGQVAVDEAIGVLRVQNFIVENAKAPEAADSTENEADTTSGDTADSAADNTADTENSQSTNDTTDSNGTDAENASEEGAE